MKDLINTQEFELHKTFFFSCVVGMSFSVIMWSTLSIHIDLIYTYLHDVLQRWTIVWVLFIAFTILNNLYQVVAHIFTATTFSGVYWFVPPGSHKLQSLSMFVSSNIIDIIGWICIFIYYKYAHPLPGLLAATHYGSVLVSVLFYETFQKYYIDNCDKRKNDDDTFRDWIWKLFKVSFVTADAIVRGWYSYHILLDMLN